MKWFDINMTSEQAETVKRRLLNKFHPDKEGGDAEITKEILADYERYKIVREELEALRANQPARPQSRPNYRPMPRPAPTPQPTLADNIISVINNIDYDKMERAASFIGRLFDAFSGDGEENDGAQDPEGD